MFRTASSPPPPTPARSRSAWGWFIAWLGVGAGYALAALAALTIGVFVLPVAVAALVFLATRRHAKEGLPGLISGPGLPLLYVAYLNRAGPGTICTARGGGQSCVDEWSPWPWLAVGALLLVVGVVVFALCQRQRNRHS
jgi:hypothetical protein